MTGELVVKNLVLLTAGLLACITTSRPTGMSLGDTVLSAAPAAETARVRDHDI